MRECGQLVPLNISWICRRLVLHLMKMSEPLLLCDFRCVPERWCVESSWEGAKVGAVPGAKEVCPRLAVVDWMGT